MANFTLNLTQELNDKPILTGTELYYANNAYNAVMTDVGGWWKLGMNKGNIAMDDNPTIIDVKSGMPMTLKDSLIDEWGATITFPCELTSNAWDLSGVGNIDVVNTLDSANTTAIDSNTTTVSTFTVDSAGAGWVVGNFCAVAIGDSTYGAAKYEIREIEAVNGTTITIKGQFTVKPAENAVAAIVNSKKIYSGGSEINTYKFLAVTSCSNRTIHKKFFKKGQIRKASAALQEKPAQIPLEIMAIGHQETVNINGTSTATVVISETLIEYP